MLRNEGMEPISFPLGLEIGCDFADIMSVKEHDFALGDPVHAKPLPPPVEPTYDDENNQFVLEDPGGRVAHAGDPLAARRRRTGAGSRTRSSSRRARRWDLQLDVVPSIDGSEVAPKLVERRFGDELVHVRDSLAAWQLRVPQLRAGWEDLEHAFGQSVSDLASLRMRSATDPGKGRLPAAGMPWFMTVFGRDTIITCLQTLLFGPELASTALRVLAELQAREDDPSIDAEPGKIVHEVRTGKAAKHWFRTYYGTVDATPLYLVLLSEVWRWTDDTSLVLELKEPALRALEWIDKWGDRDGDGFVEYQRRSDHGLENQSWKDSGDSQRFSDGRIAQTPIAPAEVQGYVYDAKRRMAELAREVWRDRELADRLNKEAKELRDRFDEAYWVEASGGYFALALDRDKQRVDSRCSNMGHLLWSGIVHPHRVDAVVDTLMGDALWSGWGIRTMSEQDAAYNPLSYHNGTVWPHDNSLVAWGLARYGRWPEMQRIAQRLLQAARYFNYQLPEVFAGLAPVRDDVPDRVPDGGASAGLGGRHAGAAAAAAARAAAGRQAPLAGDDRAAGAADVGEEPAAVRRSRVRPAVGRAARRRSRSGRGDVVEKLRVAVLAPPWFAVPPTGYGGIEWVVSLLADGLADAGHDVTLFASGDSKTRAKLHAVFETAPSELIGRTFWELQHVISCYERYDQFDVINDHSGPPSATIGGAVPTPVVHTVHGPLTGEPGALYESIAKVSPNVGLISISLNQRKPKPNLNWVANCPNALDLSVYPCSPHRGEYLLFVGRMSPDKGAHRAVAVAMEAGLPLKIAGKCREPKEIEYFSQFVEPHLGPAHGIEFLGEVNHGEKVELLQDARATLFPIEWEEPFGLVMIESMACGTPVIATRHGAVPEVIEHGRSGIIVDDYRQMVDAIEEADRLDPLVCRRSAEERFAPERMVADYLAAYRSAIA